MEAGEGLEGWGSTPVGTAASPVPTLSRPPEDHGRCYTTFGPPNWMHPPWVPWNYPGIINLKRERMNIRGTLFVDNCVIFQTNSSVGSPSLLPQCLLVVQCSHHPPCYSSDRLSRSSIQTMNATCQPAVFITQIMSAWHPKNCPGIMATSHRTFYTARTSTTP